MTDVEVPVLIAGGGPVGMTLALNLARYGVRSLLVERNPITTRHPKMDLTNGRSMELYRRLGLTDKLRDAGVPRENPFHISWVTSLVGEQLHRFEYPSAKEATDIIARENHGGHAVEAGLRVSQIEIEPVLKKAIDENLLIDVRFGTRFDTLIKNDENGIEAQIVDEATGDRHLVRAQYLAGCDGGGSRVRRQIGIELDGEMAVAGAHMVHFRTDDRDLLQRWGPTWHLQSGTGTIISQNDHDIYTLQAWLIPGLDVDKMTPEAVLEGWVGRPFDYEILQANCWHANLVVASTYRNGRVLLAGDSAHQYIPTGGYGMNSGIADAAGLAWVLAGLVQRWAGDEALNAYDRERRPTAWGHLEAARRHMGVRMEIGQLYAEAVNLSGDDAVAIERRRQLGLAIARVGNAENESWGVELGYRYDDSPIIVAEPNPPAIDPLTYNPTTQPGSRLPHVFLADGQSVHDKLGLYWTLVCLGGSDTRGLENAAREARMPLEVLRLDRPDLRLLYERDLILVRPDQHVAWRGDILPDNLSTLIATVTGR